jgi:L-cysteine:1D-myo-inositol 2-amino-2-deoxy-alpha-D-glucopyranoside ligase
MLLYDTMTRRKQPFVPAGEPVSIYVCGITPYDTTHLGHAFTYVFYDVLVRYLRYLGHSTRYVQNVTDVDDDILKKARESKVPWTRLAADQTQRYQADMTALNVLPPDIFPKATEEIPKVIEVTKVLLQKGYAYRAGGNVYFQVRRDPSYGRLSHLPRAEMLPVANERGNNPRDPLKRDPLDFVLWQHSAPDEPRWDSPWGMGRPGWHVECSAMAMRYLGETIDIHGGGYDLVFPHHDSEIVQSENYSGRQPFARYWVHTAMVYYQGEKMSKSRGNLVMVHDLLDRHSSDAIRLMLLRHHHTEPWEFEEAELEEASRICSILTKAVRGSRAKLPLRPHELEEGAAFLDAMDEDMNTPSAIDLLTELAERILRGRGRGPSAPQARELLLQMGRILGLRML